MPRDDAAQRGVVLAVEGGLVAPQGDEVASCYQTASGTSPPRTAMSSNASSSCWETGRWRIAAI